MVDPDNMADSSIDELMDAYLQLCEKYELEPAALTERQALVDQLSADFVKSK
jgi:hypothetical protein